MAVCRFAVEMVVQMLQEEQDKDESEMTQNMCQSQAGVVGVSGNPAHLHEEGFSDEIL